ncbi:uncharacterized protein G2W53_031289 [Senna tora]|uniref:Uncharacterized protein n=1 Tax=Senna tora TaxID=362788 RepID=A0A834T912_9FABA|nr:uncharacterized protein G2W53_031289 [Senna tora]
MANKMVQTPDASNSYLSPQTIDACFVDLLGFDEHPNS